MLSDDDIKKVARLASLELTSEEIEKYKNQLGNIVNMVEGLKQVDTTGVVPTSQTTNLENVFREDKIETDTALDQESTISQGEKTHNGYFVVPMLLKEKDN